MAQLIDLKALIEKAEKQNGNGNGQTAAKPVEPTKPVEPKTIAEKPAEEKPAPLHNYTGNGVEGSRYRTTRDMDIADIAKEVRSYAKKQYPDFSFSVTIERYSGGQSMTIALMSAPFEVCTGFKDHRSGNTEPFKGHCTINQNFLNEETKNGYLLIDAARLVLLDVYQYANSYNYSDCDSMTDYFNVRFYITLNIGKWNKAFEVVKAEKTEQAKTASIAKQTACIIGSYKGHATIKLPNGFTFGVAKARAILANIEEIKAFVENHKK